MADSTDSTDSTGSGPGLSASVRADATLRTGVVVYQVKSWPRLSATIFTSIPERSALVQLRMSKRPVTMTCSPL